MNQAIQLDTNNSRFYAKRADCWYDEREFDKAKSDYDEAIRIDPTNHYAYRGRGLVWYKQGVLDKAIIDHSEAIRLEPRDFVAFMSRGNDWLDKEMYDNAITDYSEAIRLEPDVGWLYNNRGNAWRFMGEYGKAIEDYDVFVRLDSNNSTAYYNRGDVLYENGEFDKAISDFDEAIRLDPSDASTYDKRGCVWRAAEVLDKAIADFSETIRRDPEYQPAYRHRGEALFQQEDYDQAFADFNEAIRLLSSDSESYCFRANVWTKKRSYAKASQDFSLAVESDPKNALAYNGQAWLWAVCPVSQYRDGRKAVVSAQKACELTEWKEPLYLDTLAAAYAESADFEQAVKWQSEASKLAAEVDKAEFQSRLELYRQSKPYRQHNSVDPETINAASVVQGNTEFAFDLYNYLRTQSGNLIFSPYSLSTAMALSYGGAAGDTQVEIANTFHFAMDKEPFHAAYIEIVRKLQNRRIKRSYDLHIANAIWAHKDLTFKPSYFQLIEDRYQAALKELEFQSDPDESRREINRWVEGHTNKRIKDLIQPGVIDAETRLVLTNAICLKAQWSRTFSKEQTYDENFNTSRQASIKIPMMHQTESFRYLNADTFELLELPYKGNDLSMLIVLPKQVDGLEDVEKLLSATALAQWIEGLELHIVDVSLPKFTTTAEFKLNDTLQTLGMHLAFDRDRADFSDMTERPQGLCIAAVVHQAFMEVDEDGSEAAAATAVVMAPGAGAVPIDVKRTVFRADHPFLFLIREPTTGSILFVGRVVKP